MTTGELPALAAPPRMRGVLPLPLDAGQFADWQGLLLAHTGIVMPAARQEFFAACLRDQLAAHGLQELPALRASLEAHDEAAGRLWGDLVARLTLQQTYFFRHQPSLDYLVQQWLPSHLERLGTLPLNGWNVGCGTGEESWTLAMVLDAAMAQHPGGFALAGSELSAQALAVAQHAIYPQERLREIGAAEVLRYCHVTDDGRFSIDARLRQQVSFHPLDLAEGAEPPFARLDLIFCQNVLIYFAPPRRLQLLAQFTQMLAPGGLLVLGPGEVPGETHPGLRRVAARGVLAFVRQGAA